MKRISFFLVVALFSFAFAQTGGRDDGRLGE